MCFVRPRMGTLRSVPILVVELREPASNASVTGTSLAYDVTALSVRAWTSGVAVVDVFIEGARGNLDRVPVVADERLRLPLALWLLVLMVLGGRLAFLLGGGNRCHPDRGEGTAGNSLDGITPGCRTGESGNEFVELFRVHAILPV